MYSKFIIPQNRKWIKIVFDILVTYIKGHRLTYSYYYILLCVRDINIKILNLKKTHLT